MDNKLILDTRSKEMICKSLSTILNITEHELIKKLYSVYEKYEKNNNINLFYELKNSFNLDDNFFFPYVTIHHFTARLDEDKKNFEVSNLENTLLKENSLTLFLKEYGLEFKKENNQIKVYYKNKLQSFEGNSPIASMMRNRLEKLTDSCVNGFLFNNLNNPNYTFLRDIPEILKHILTYLNLNEVKYEYMKKSIGLRVSIIVNINDLILDYNQNITSKFEKSKYLLEDIFYYLGDDTKNSVIRLKDDKDVCNEEILEIQEI